MAEAKTYILPRELVESQLSMFELLQAMYPPVEDDTDTLKHDMLDTIRKQCEAPDWPQDTDYLPSSLDLIVTIPLEDGVGSNIPMIQMNVTIPIRSEERDPIETPPITYSIRQPSWMSRAQVTDLVAAMPMDDVLTAFDYVKENTGPYLGKDKTIAGPLAVSSSLDNTPLLRVWFYFPSLSTREKRKDLVTYAPRYSLTGFVLAGKPGVLCLEGTSRNIDDYMNDIKNESWGDIPSHQKKVSERFREQCGTTGRKFEGMREITDDLGEKRGARKNRGDMAALEAFLRDNGVGESFSKVIMGN